MIRDSPARHTLNYFTQVQRYCFVTGPDLSGKLELGSINVDSLGTWFEMGKRSQEG